MEFHVKSHHLPRNDKLPSFPSILSSSWEAEMLWKQWDSTYCPQKCFKTSCFCMFGNMRNMRSLNGNFMEFHLKSHHRREMISSWNHLYKIIQPCPLALGVALAPVLSERHPAAQHVLLARISAHLRAVWIKTAIRFVSATAGKPTPAQIIWLARIFKNLQQ